MSIFSRTPAKNPRRNAFNLSHEVKFTCQMGELIPFMCEDVLPGDTFKARQENLLRLAPMLAPVMHRINVKVEYYFVPLRLIWDEWESFITAGSSGELTPNPPHFENWTFPIGSLGDYLGMPTEVTSNGEWVSSLPFRAYARIWNDYYRDQNIQPEIIIPTGSGNDDSTFTEANKIRFRAWSKDYFTSALPWPQRGPEVSLPLTGNAPIKRITDDFAHDFEAASQRPGAFTPATITTDSAGKSLLLSGNDSEAVPQRVNIGNFEADLTDVTATTINELRRAVKLQEWQENNARGGSRYIEQLLSHFGVRSSDARLQRPEFLGGGTSPVVVSEVLQTSSTDATSPQANMAGHGVSAGSNYSFTKYFEEHGFIIGLFSVMPKAGYFQGIPKKFDRFDNMEYGWPEFANLGEQPIKSSEIWFDTNPAINAETFGYTPRYAEYKFAFDRVSGDFRKNLDFWHLARKFTAVPRLNSQFIECHPSNRIFAVEDDSDKLWVQLYNHVRVLRKLPKFGVPHL